MAGGVFKISCPTCITQTLMSDAACPRCGNGLEDRRDAAALAFAERHRVKAEKKAVKAKAIAASEKEEAVAAAEKAAVEKAEAEAAEKESTKADAEAKRANKAQAKADKKTAKKASKRK